MRKILFLNILMLASFMGFAQFSTVTFSPVTFTGEDSVVMTIDLTGTNLAGETDLYIWIFANKDAGPGFPAKDGITTNTDWGNSPMAARFRSLGNNKWSYGFVGSNLFGLTAGQLKHFQFLIKTKTGNKQSADSPPFAFAPIVYVPRLYRLFPEQFDQDDAVTLFVDQNYATSMNEVRMTPVDVTVTMYNGTNVYGTPKTFVITNIGTKIGRARTFIPSYEWNVPAGIKLTSFTYVVNGNSFDQNGAVIRVSGAVNTKVFDVLN